MKNLKNSGISQLIFRLNKITVSILLCLAITIVSCTKTTFNEVESDITAPTVLSASPANNNTGVPISARPAVTFSEAMDASSITQESFTLNQGTSLVPGTITYNENIATFSPAWELSPGKLYTGMITTGVKDKAGNAVSQSFSWSFTTLAAVDVAPPTVASVTPAANSISVTRSINPSVIFSEAINPSTVTASTFSVKQGTTAVGGTIAVSGTTATFTPSALLAANTSFVATITTGVKDVAGNALTANYSWTFTTAAEADVTPPTVLSVVPAASATSIALNTTVKVNFSEPVNSSTVTASTFTVKQGTSSVAGTISYSGTTATFTPSSALAANTIYTATVTTGVKDASNNALASNYTWTFTTVAVTGKSFSADVMPILNICNTCHTHGWTPSSNASTYYTNLVNAGYVKPTAPTTSKIYQKISGGHPSSTVTTEQKNTILTWMTEGSQNN
jgi:hypothetical protein